MEAELADHEVEEELFKLAAGERKRKRCRADSRSSPSRWRSPGAQQTYASKLLHALRRSPRASPSRSSPPRSRAVREAADRVLAFAARGRTRWSRAILCTSRAVKLRRKSRAVAPRCARPRKTWSSSSAAAAGKKKAPAAALGGKVRVLGRLVPGCRKLPFPSLLEEASDYIAALEMQVRAMSALADALSSLGSGGAPPRLAGSPPTPLRPPCSRPNRADAMAGSSFVLFLSPFSFLCFWGNFFFPAL